MMKHKIDLSNWSRKEHFEFFKKFEDPCHGIVVNIDCTNIYRKAKLSGVSFYMMYLHKIITAVNDTEVLRYRIERDEVYCYDVIHSAATVGREDGTFGFSFFSYNRDREVFITDAQTEIERVKSSSGLMVDENASRPDLIQFSAVPWFSFTGLKHARGAKNENGTPKISIGKIFSENGLLKMPVQIEVHHGLVDGIHLGELIDNISKQFSEI